MNARTCLVTGGISLFFALNASAQLTATQIAYDVGLDPLGMAIAGLEGEEAVSSLSQMAAADELQTTLASQLATADSLMATITSLKASLFEAYSEADAAALQSTNTALATALGNIADTRDAIRIVGLAGLQQSQINDAQACIDSRAYSVLPKYRLLFLTSAEWLDLESACRDKAIAEAMEQSMPQVPATLLGDYDLETEVLDAQLNYATFLSAVESAFSISEE